MDQLPDLTVAAVPWWHYAIALVLVVAGFILSGFARRAVLRLLQRTRGIPEPLVNATARFAGYLVVFLGIGLALAAIGLNVQPLLAIVLIVVVIAGFVLKGVADNFAAGVLLQTSHPVSPGDEVTVEIADGTATGIVVELASRTVVISTYDGRTIHVPNAQLVSNAIVVTPAGAPRRSDVQVRIERGGRDVDALLERVAQAVSTADGVQAEPAAHATAVQISPERLIASVQFWHAGSETATVVASVVRDLSASLADAGVIATVTSAAAPPPLTPPDAI